MQVILKLKNVFSFIVFLWSPTKFCDVIVPPKNNGFSSNDSKIWLTARSSHFFFIPLQAKWVGEFIEIRHKKISPTCILSTLGCLWLCDSVTLSLCNFVAYLDNLTPVQQTCLTINRLEISLQIIISKKISN